MQNLVHLSIVDEASVGKFSNIVNAARQDQYFLCMQFYIEKKEKENDFFTSVKRAF